MVNELCSAIAAFTRHPYIYIIVYYAHERFGSNTEMT